MQFGWCSRDGGEKKRGCWTRYLEALIADRKSKTTVLEDQEMHPKKEGELNSGIVNHTQLWTD